MGGGGVTGLEEGEVAFWGAKRVSQLTYEQMVAKRKKMRQHVAAALRSQVVPSDFFGRHIYRLLTGCSCSN